VGRQKRAGGAVREESLARRGEAVPGAKPRFEKAGLKKAWFEKAGLKKPV